MSDFAILLTGEGQTPAVVRLNAAGGALQLIRAHGAIENVPWWRLYRLDEDRSMHRFRRVDRRDWELRIMSGADQQLLAHVGSRRCQRILVPLRRLELLKIGAGMLVLLLTIAQHAPPEWMAKTVPEWAQERLVDGAVAEEAPLRCGHQGGEQAVRKLLVSLDPQLGPKVDIVAIREGAFVVAATPGFHLYMYRSSMAEIDPLALPALLAHMRHGDPMTAIMRQHGFVGTWAAILHGGGNNALKMYYSGLEERRADLEAMQMMRRAGMPLKPAADLFDKMRISKEQGGYFGYDYRDFHFGIDRRAERWAAAARSDAPAARPALTPVEQDAIFNFCWTGPIPPLPKGARRAPANTLPEGSGALTSAH